MKRLLDFVATLGVTWAFLDLMLLSFTPKSSFTTPADYEPWRDHKVQRCLAAGVLSIAACQRKRDLGTDLELRKERRNGTV